MAKYRKKPVVIEAVRWKGEPILFDVPDWLIEAQDEKKIYFTARGNAVIQTLEGDHFVRKGDYIIRGVKGELYPCKPDIFEMTYEKVESEENNYGK